jgi:hypothetical protein
MKDSGQTAPSTPQAPSKKPYEPPQVIRHGTIRELTAAGVIKPSAGDSISQGV